MECNGMQFELVEKVRGPRITVSPRRKLPGATPKRIFEIKYSVFQSRINGNSRAFKAWRRSELYP